MSTVSVVAAILCFTGVAFASYDYGYQTRNTYAPSHGYGHNSHGGYGHQSHGGYGHNSHDGYGHAPSYGHGGYDGGHAGYGGSHGGYQNHGDYGYQTRTTYGYGHGNQYGHNQGYGGGFFKEGGGGYDNYKPNSYTNDPCKYQPPGDYSLEGAFKSLFPGVDSQCNFVKCANYKAYVNPCSTGSKNNNYGRAHPKFGFCYVPDQSKYCGTPIAAPYYKK